MILTGTIFNFRDLLDSLSPIVFPTIAIACSDSTSDAPGRRAGAYRRPDRNATSCNRRTPFAGPFAVAELVEAILPHVPETVPVNIPLMEIGPDGGTARNRPVHPDRGSRNPGGALVEIVPHLAFVTAQKAFAGVTQVDASLLTGTLYELQHLAELCVGNRERRIVLGPADREDREDAPIFHSFGDQQAP